MRRSLLGLGLLVAAGGLPACGNDDRPASNIVNLSHASYSTPSELAIASEYLLRVTVEEVSGVREPIGEDSALARFRSSATILEVYAQRPDTPVILKPNMRIETYQILLSNAQLGTVFNSDDLRGTFPTEDQRVVVHGSYLLFGLGRKNYAGALLIEIGGYGKIDITTGQVTFGGLPGPLAGDRNDLTTVVESVRSEFATRAPWRSVDAPPPTVQPLPGDGRPPTSVGGG